MLYRDISIHKSFFRYISHSAEYTYSRTKEEESIMNPELMAFQQKLDAYQDEFYQLLREYARIRKISPRVRAESSKVLEQYMIRVNRMVKQVSREFNDDLLQGVSLLKIKMMQ